MYRFMEKKEGSMSLQKVNKDRIRVDFLEPTKKVPTEEDKLPEGMTEDELKQEYS